MDAVSVTAMHSGTYTHSRRVCFQTAAKSLVHPHGHRVALPLRKLSEAVGIAVHRDGGIWSGRAAWRSAMIQNIVEDAVKESE
jgi:hypothetical protein